MVIDLNRVAMYGREDGTLSDSRQRVIWCLTDAIVAGEGDGPLASRPAPLGLVTFSGCPVAAEIAHCALLRLDAQKIPLVREAFGRFRWPLVPEDASMRYRYNGSEVDHRALARAAGIDADPAPNWAGHIEDLSARRRDLIDDEAG